MLSLNAGVVGVRRRMRTKRREESLQYKERSEKRNERLILLSVTFDMTMKLSLPLFIYVEIKESLWFTDS